MKINRHAFIKAIAGIAGLTGIGALKGLGKEPDSLQGRHYVGIAGAKITKDIQRLMNYQMSTVIEPSPIPRTIRIRRTVKYAAKKP